MRKNLKRAGNAGKAFPALPFSLFSAPASLFFLSLVFTNRSLCGGERVSLIQVSVIPVSKNVTTP